MQAVIENVLTLKRVILETVALRKWGVTLMVSEPFGPNRTVSWVAIAGQVSGFFRSSFVRCPVVLVKIVGLFPCLQLSSTKIFICWGVM